MLTAILPSPTRETSKSNRSLSSRFECDGTRKLLLDAFTQNMATRNGCFHTNNLGLWASFLSGLGMDPRSHAHLKHAILECSFLNVSFSAEGIDFGIFDRDELRAELAGNDCVMVPCVREEAHVELVSRGYVAIPSFFACYASFEVNWIEHLRATIGSAKVRETRRQMKRVDDHYTTTWMSLEELCQQRPLFDDACRIYYRNTQKFEYPAVHYPKAVLDCLGRSCLANDFRVALTFDGRDLAQVVLCFVDPTANYLAALVQGIDYDKLRPSCNLYNRAYTGIYEYMAKNSLSVFDMGRGFVEHKRRIGANRVDRLYTYLKPLSAEAAEHVAAIRLRAAHQGRPLPAETCS